MNVLTESEDLSSSKRTKLADAGAISLLGLLNSDFGHDSRTIAAHAKAALTSASALGTLASASAVKNLTECSNAVIADIVLELIRYCDHDGLRDRKFVLGASLEEAARISADSSRAQFLQAAFEFVTESQKYFFQSGGTQFARIFEQTPELAGCLIQALDRKLNAADIVTRRIYQDLGSFLIRHFRPINAQDNNSQDKSVQVLPRDAFGFEVIERSKTSAPAILELAFANDSAAFIKDIHFICGSHDILSEANTMRFKMLSRAAFHFSTEQQHEVAEAYANCLTILVEVRSMNQKSESVRNYRSWIGTEVSALLPTAASPIGDWFFSILDKQLESYRSEKADLRIMQGLRDIGTTDVVLAKMAKSDCAHYPNIKGALFAQLTYELNDGDERGLCSADNRENLKSLLAASLIPPPLLHSAIGALKNADRYSVLAQTANLVLATAGCVSALKGTALQGATLPAAADAKVLLAQLSEDSVHYNKQFQYPFESKVARIVAAYRIAQNESPGSQQSDEARKFCIRYASFIPWRRTFVLDSATKAHADNTESNADSLLIAAVRAARSYPAGLPEAIDRVKKTASPEMLYIARLIELASR